MIPPLSALSLDELTAWVTAAGEPRYRAQQVLAWLRRGAGDFDQMLDLPASLRSRLAESFRLSSLTPIVANAADSGLTTKVLYGLAGGYTVEAVIMRYADRTTLCISSQVGCPIGCTFCATGQGPFGRNLASHEIVDQAFDASRRLKLEGRRLSHVVFMGMGEPMANYAAVMESIRRIVDPRWIGISPRRIVLSTSGLVPRIARLSGEGLPVTLAISLHAARDELRDELVPINRKYPLSQLIPAAQSYAAASGRRLSYEWVVLAGVNDNERDAEELGRLLEPRLSHVNLIPFNPVAGTPYREPEPRALARFAAAVRRRGLNVTVRDTRGRDADAACGQLRARVEREQRELEAREPLFSRR